MPNLDFGDFLNEFPPLYDQRTQRRSPPPIPSWCPALPSFTRKGVTSDELPIFYDLSSLPEPKEKPVGNDQPSGRGLQTQHGCLDRSPKESRYFPPASLSIAAELDERRPPTPKVKLPPTSRKLHVLKDEAKQLLSVEASARPNPRKPASIAESVEHTVSNSAKRRTGEALDACAASLWRILMTPPQSPVLAHVDPYQAGIPPELHGSIESARPVDSGAASIPCPHANSLVGYSNEIVNERDLAGFPQRKVLDSGNPGTTQETASVSTIATPNTGFDEASYADHIIAHIALPPTPPLIPHFGSLLDLHPILPVDYVDVAAELSNSDDHYQSELDLFELYSPPATDPSEEVVDVAAFLKLGHAKHCWCCGEVPLLLKDESTTDEDDEDWVLFPPTTEAVAERACVSNAAVHPEKSARGRGGARLLL